MINKESSISSQPPLLPAPFPTMEQSQSQSKEIPISFDSDRPPTEAAAAKIQSAYRSHQIRSLYKTISSVNSSAAQLQHLIQLQETVDSIRSDDREKLRMNEALMGLLLKLDSVPGIDPTVREARRKVSRRIVGLQEILDALSDSRVEDLGQMMRNWEEMLEEMEGEAFCMRGNCYEHGRNLEIHKFCLEKLGFRCMERFLRGV